MLKRILFGIASAILVQGLNIPLYSTDLSSKPKAKYVFYFIGDGMGLAQVSAAEAFLATNNPQIQLKSLHMSNFPVIGLSTTYAANRLITCSAAAGTALASGFKTSINTIGMDASRTASLQSVAAMAKAKGMKVGIITTVCINHATPAVFYAHRPDRNDYYTIALQLPESGFDLFGYGGIKDAKGENGDRPDAYDIAVTKGYKIIRGQKDFLSLQELPGKIIVLNDRLDEGKAVPFIIDQTPQDMPLSQFVEKSIQLLDNPEGFFMMVEGGLIDWACHSNDAATAIKEVIDLDKAIGAALDFMKLHPNETLIVVTADHETGGMAMGNALMKYESNFNLLSSQKVSESVLKKHINDFRETKCKDGCQFEEIFPLLNKYTDLGLNIPLTGFDSIQLKMAFETSMLRKIPFSEKDGIYLLYGDEEPLSVTAVKMISQKAGIGWTTWSHSGIPVPVRAKGVNQEKFGGYFDNTKIPELILEAMGISSEIFMRDGK
ncbi:MAG TPA: alkaline phosphatase [Bacteroidales bacterium]|jgi:alkaline phosphatase|nr:alkaline phosphatase [Bacteroidales bacterium]MDI9572978.1 alkaline phosphatase [Bacteroidota bacterium]OQC58820.1 MAG: Alkaline phosphatase 3 precursor [Bacteroidetes bacterium ADurb.Bin012]MBP9512610.1 alkaline phosphatase [Bacteroidales bacterium]MBP9589095.1 alkaline phosphatase [Bacteroidales bacterium]